MEAPSALAVDLFGAWAGVRELPRKSTGRNCKPRARAPLIPVPVSTVWPPEGSRACPRDV